MLTLIAGPPLAGKTTYAREQAQPGDLLLDSDALYAALSGQPLYDRPEHLRPFVWAAFFGVLRELGRGSYPDAFVVQCAASRQQRDRYRRMNDARVVVLETPLEVCLARLDERPTAVHGEWRQAIEQWWELYDRDRRDVVIR